MKSFLSLIVIFSLISASLQQSTRPGKCENTDDCTSNSATCVAVESSAGDTEAQQCVPGTVCAGQVIGKCPTFSAWPSSYRSIQPLCAFVQPENCKLAESSGTGSTDVDCMNKTIVNGNDTSYVYGIYSCVDLTRYKADNLGYVKNLTDTQIEACAGNSSELLCNGQGTCGPVNANSNEYKCYCNAGFSEADNCYNANSNACDSLGQCGEEGSCNLGSSECECESGATGLQCSQCTAGESTSCNNQGTCQEDGSCLCNEGYTGDFCAKISIEGGSANGLPVTNVVVLFFTMLIATTFY